MMRMLVPLLLWCRLGWAGPCDPPCAALVRSYEYDLADYYRSNNLSPEPSPADRRTLNAFERLCVRHCETGGAGSDCLIKTGGGNKSRACAMPPGLKTVTWAELQCLAPSFRGTTATLGTALLDAKLYSPPLRTQLMSLRDLVQDPPRLAGAIVAALAGTVCPAVHAEVSALPAHQQASHFVARCKPPAQPIARVRYDLPLWQLYLAIALESEARREGFAANPTHRRAIDALTGN